MNTGPEPSPLVHEQLSAWLDDELPAGEQALLFARLERSPDLRARVARYGLIGSSLRDGLAGTPGSQLPALRLSGRVSAAIAQPETPAIGAEAGRGRRVLPYVAAAALALLAVALVPVLRAPTLPGTEAGLVAGSQPVSGPAIGFLPASHAPGQAPISPRRLTSYLVYHGEYSGMLSAKVMDSHIVNQRAYAVALQPAEGISPP
jgi:hypothetical protein